LVDVGSYTVFVPPVHANPGRHFVGVIVPVVGQLKPAGQIVQALAPILLEYVPDGQKLPGVGKAGVGQNFPLGHCIQSVIEFPP